MLAITGQGLCRGCTSCTIALLWEGRQRAMVDVFISWSRNDHARVAMLARAVEAEGCAVWWDADLPPHQSYGDVFTAKIGAARAAIVVWSADAVKSEWVRAEADMVRNLKKLQTAIGDVMLPLPFNQIQNVDIGAWNGEPDHPGWRKVKASLAELCRGNADFILQKILAQWVLMRPKTYRIM